MKNTYNTRVSLSNNRVRLLYDRDSGLSPALCTHYIGFHVTA